MGYQRYIPDVLKHSVSPETPVSFANRVIGKPVVAGERVWSGWKSMHVPLILSRNLQQGDNSTAVHSLLPTGRTPCYLQIAGGDLSPRRPLHSHPLVGRNDLDAYPSPRGPPPWRPWVCGSQPLCKGAGPAFHSSELAKGWEPAR